MKCPSGRNLISGTYLTEGQSWTLPILEQTAMAGAVCRPISLQRLLLVRSILNITEHYTDTAGFTEHVFALMHLLGFAFAPRIRDLHDKRLFIHGKAELYQGLQSIISTTSLNLKETETHWHEVLRLASSIKQGTVWDGNIST